MIPIEQKAPPGDRTATEWNHVANVTPAVGESCVAGFYFCSVNWFYQS